MGEAIRATALSKKYGDTVAVDGLDLTIPSGELFALLGVNGAGKTTVIKMLCCLTRPTGGDATVGGFNILSDELRVKGIIGVSPQESAVAPNLSVKENLALICGIHGIRAKAREDKISALVEQFGLRGVLSRKAGVLSGGWQRRVSIAMAMISEPSILFLDEPTLGLDVIARSELWDIICALKGKTTIVLTTHYMEEAEALSDRVGIMKDGRMLAVGAPCEIIKKTGCEKLEDAFISIVRGESV